VSQFVRCVDYEIEWHTRRILLDRGKALESYMRFALIHRRNSVLIQKMLATGKFTTFGGKNVFQTICMLMNCRFCDFLHSRAYCAIFIHFFIFHLLVISY
jgi:hypothetical protein